MNKVLNKLFSNFDFGSGIADKIWKHGCIYFVELLSLWIVTTSGRFNHPLCEIQGFQIDVMKVQTFGFLFGAIYFGLYRGEKWKKGQIVNRINNLEYSLRFYILGVFLSILYICIFKDIERNNWIFALSRLITCFGISGGIGINLTILALAVKDGKHSAPIFLFTAFGVLGTVFSSFFLHLFPDAIILTFVLCFILGAYQWLKLKKVKGAYFGQEYINNYEYRIKNRQDYWSRVFSFVLLGLPTFYLAGILASKADLLIKNGWFYDLYQISSNNNLSPLFLGIQYLGFSFVCVLLSLPIKKIFFLEKK